jgi:hypothetical protein
MKGKLSASDVWLFCTFKKLGFSLTLWLVTQKFFCIKLTLNSGSLRIYGIDSLVKSLFFRPLYLMVLKNNFVRSYPEKRTRGKIGKEGAHSARARWAGVFPFKIYMNRCRWIPGWDRPASVHIIPSKQQNQKKSSKGQFWPFFANLLKAIVSPDGLV